VISNIKTSRRDGLECNPDTNSKARTKKDRNVFNFEIPQWARKEVDKTSFSGLVNKVNKMMTKYHLAGKSNSYPDIFHLLVN
jgi:tRNA A37 threonylcarbamoyltransferase TsaD